MSRAHRSEAGFTLIAAMVLAGVVSMLVATYSRHVIVDSWSSMAAEASISAREECFSNLDYARWAVEIGQPVSTSLMNDGAATSIVVSDLSGDHKSILVQTVRQDGRDATRLAEASLLPAPLMAPATADDLPRIPMDVVTALLSDPTVAKTYISGETSLSNVDLNGLVILQDDSELRLDNVVVHGCIVSATTMSADSFGIFGGSDAPTLVLDGNVRIDGSDALPDLAVLMPDGRIMTGSNPGRLQIHGDVIAYTMDLDLPGALGGNCLAVGQMDIDPGIELLGAHRKPRDWSSQLELGGAWNAEFIAVVPNVPTLGEVDPIVNYWSP
jgi:hypothetical protein